MDFKRNNLIDRTPIQHDNDAWMVENRERLPLLEIDRDVFKKSKEDKEQLKEAIASNGKIKTISYQIISPSKFVALKKTQRERSSYAGKKGKRINKNRGI